MSDFYQILGISRSATQEEIQKAYRKAARKYHPDVNSEADAVLKFKKIQEAYDVLSDAEKKTVYDGRNFFRQEEDIEIGAGSSFSFERVMNEFFGSSNYRGSNIHLTVIVTLEDIRLGSYKKIAVKRKIKCTACQGDAFTEYTSCMACNGSGQLEFFQASLKFSTNCPNCNGNGKLGINKCQTCTGKGFQTSLIEHAIVLEIPAGIEDNIQLRYAGHGHPASKTGNAGDLIVRINVQEHEIFTRNNNNLLVDIPLSYTQLALGCNILVPTLEDKFVEVKIPAGTTSHSKFKVSGKGLLDPSGKFGDIVVTVKLDTPKKYSDEYKVLLENLAELEKNITTPKKEMWNKKIENYKGKT
jgi:molecular chaperone DnaJ